MILNQQKKCDAKRRWGHFLLFLDNNRFIRLVKPACRLMGFSVKSRGLLKIWLIKKITNLYKKLPKPGDISFIVKKSCENVLKQVTKLYWVIVIRKFCFLGVEVLPLGVRVLCSAAEVTSSHFRFCCVSSACHGCKFQCYNNNTGICIIHLPTWGRVFILLLWGSMLVPPGPFVQVFLAGHWTKLLLGVNSTLNGCCCCISVWMTQWKSTVKHLG